MNNICLVTGISVSDVKINIYLVIVMPYAHQDEIEDLDSVVLLPSHRAVYHRLQECLG